MIRDVKAIVARGDDLVGDFIGAAALVVLFVGALHLTAFL